MSNNTNFDLDVDALHTKTDIENYHERIIDRCNATLHSCQLAPMQVIDIRDSIAEHRRELIKIRNRRLQSSLTGASLLQVLTQ